MTYIASSSPMSARLIENLLYLPTAIHDHVTAKGTVLRPKQREAVTSIAEMIFAYERAVAMIMPTGTGKTVMFSSILDGIVQGITKDGKRRRVLFVSDSVEGIEQTHEKVNAFAGIDMSRYYGKTKVTEGDFVLTTYNSWQGKNFPFDPEEFDLVVLDEAHRAISDARLKTLQKYTNAVHLALTATPDYDEQRSVLNHFKEGFRMTPREAVEHHLISSFRNIVLNSDIEIDLEEIGLSTKGDFNNHKLQKAVNTKARNQIGADYLLFGTHPDTGDAIRDLRGIVSCTNVKHATDFAHEANELFAKHFPGQAPEHGFIQVIHGETPNREDILKWHKEGKIGYLAYADMLNQNYDDQGISVCLNLRPTASGVVSAQRGGRAMRLDEHDPAKIALIIDVRDKYNGEVKKRPLLYGEAIGEITIITEETKERVKVKRAAGELDGGTSYGAREQAIIDDLNLKIKTDEETILSIIREKNGDDDIPQKTENDLTSKDIAKILRIREVRALNFFKEQIVLQELFQEDPENNIAPIVKVKLVKSGSNRMLTIDREDIGNIESELVSYAKKDDNELSGHDIGRLLNMNTSTATNFLREQYELMKAHEKDPENNPAPIINVKKFISHSQREAWSIDKADLPIIKSKFAAYPVKTKDDLTSVDLAKVLKIKSDRAVSFLRDQKMLQDKYQEDPENNQPPIVNVKFVRAGSGNALAIDVADLPIAQSEFVIYPLKTDDDLSSTDLAKVLQIKSDRAINFIKDQKVLQDKHQEDPENNVEPLVKVRMVRAGTRATLAINRGDLPIIQSALVSHNKRSDDDMTSVDIAKELGVSHPTALIFLQKQQELQKCYQEDPENNPMPSVKVRIVRAGTVESLAIDRSDLSVVQMKLASHALKSDSDLTALDLANMLNISKNLALNFLREQEMLQQQYKENPDKNPAPIVKVRMVRTGARVHLAMDNIELPIAKEALATYSYGTVDDLTASYFAKEFKVSFKNAAKFMKQQHETQKKYEEDAVGNPAPIIPVKIVKRNGRITSSIRKDDLGTFIQNFFPHKLEEFLARKEELLGKQSDDTSKNDTPKIQPE